MLRFRLIYSMLQGSQIIDQGGSYVFVVKGNQKSLLEQLRDDYDWDRRAAFTAVDGGHGRIETRTIRVSEDFADCPEWLDFPGARVRAPSKRDDDQEDRAAAATADGVPANELAPATSEPGDLDPADAREEEHRGGDGKAQLQSPGRARAGQFPNRSPRLTGAGKSACVPAPQTGIEPESPLPTLPEHPPSHSQDLYRHQCEPPEPGPNQPLATLEFP